MRVRRAARSRPDDFFVFKRKFDPPGIPGTARERKEADRRRKQGADTLINGRRSQERIGRDDGENGKQWGM